MIKTFLINLTERTDRLESASLEFNKAGVTFERIEAIGANKFNRDEKALVSPGVWACWESHKLCYEKLLASNEFYALICEDDIKIQNERALYRAIRWGIQNKIDVLQIGFLEHGVRNKIRKFIDNLEIIFFKSAYFLVKTNAGSIIPGDLSNRMRVKKYGETSKSFVPDSFFPGTHCYLISRNAAGKFLELNNPQFLSADEFMISLAGMRSFKFFRSRESAVSQSNSVPSIQDRFFEG